MGPGSMTTSWRRHQSVKKLADRFFQRHLAACRLKKQLRTQENQAKTRPRGKAIPNQKKIPTED